MNLTVSATELSAVRAHPRVVGSANTASAVECVLADSERQPCEVWTRVMGYHRPVSSFNTGKQAEHAERRFFATPPCGRR